MSRRRKFAVAGGPEDEAGYWNPLDDRPGLAALRGAPEWAPYAWAKETDSPARRQAIEDRAIFWRDVARRRFSDALVEQGRIEDARRVKACADEKMRAVVDDTAINLCCVYNIAAEILNPSDPRTHAAFKEACIDVLAKGLRGFGFRDARPDWFAFMRR